MVRALDALRCMRRRLIEEANVQALGIVLAAGPQQDGAALGIEAGELPPAGVARGGFVTHPHLV